MISIFMTCLSWQHGSYSDCFFHNMQVLWAHVHYRSH